jgi:hypothetical protein
MCPAHPVNGKTARYSASVSRSLQDHFAEPADYDLSQSNQLVRVVVTCANRKVAVPSRDLRLGTYTTGLRARATQWTSRLDSPRTDPFEARHLYQGEHWSVVKRMVDQASHFGCTAEVWIVSAGYGLVPISANLESYSATFSPGSDDSVARSKSDQRDNQDWWGLLASCRNRDLPGPRNLTELALQDTSAPMIVALSKTYLQAVLHDLTDAAEVMDKKADLLLVSTGTPPYGLEEVQLPCDARFLNSLGGSRTSLNARVANHIIETSGQHEFNSAKVKNLLQKDLDQSKDLLRYDRRKQTDFELRNWIRTRLNNDSSSSSLLRELRDAGFACEQRRFAGLYEEVIAGNRR